LRNEDRVVAAGLWTEGLASFRLDLFIVEHIVDDEGIDNLGLRPWFDEMRDPHNAEEKAEETEPQENSSSTPHRPS
jgi:hypothetical protein